MATCNQVTAEIAKQFITNPRISFSQALDLGQRLIALKQQFKGKFVAQIGLIMPFTYRTAARYMNIWRYRKEFEVHGIETFKEAYDLIDHHRKLAVASL